MITGFATFSNGESQKDYSVDVLDEDVERIFMERFIRGCYNYAKSLDMNVVSIIFLIEKQ